MTARKPLVNIAGQVQALGAADTLVDGSGTPYGTGTGSVTSVASANADATVASPTTTPVITIVSAPKWSTARTLSYTGNVTGSGSVDGSANVATALTIGAGQVTEAMQVLANNATGNVTTARHGYAPILPNDATKYLDGTGAYTVPPGTATGTVTTTGSPSSGNLTKFSGASSVTSGDLSGDVTTSGTLVTTIGALKVATGMIQASAVTLAKIQNAAANSVLLGSGASGSGSAYVELTLGTNLSITGTTLNATAGGSGTVTSVTSATGDITVATGTTTPVLTAVSAPKLTTGRTIGITGDVTYTSPSFDGSGNVTAAATLATVTVAKGGTGATTLAAHGVLLGNGTSAVAVTGAGTSGQVLTSNGASADPTFQNSGGALVLISEVVTSGSQASVTFSSIATTWRHLIVRVTGRGTASANTVQIQAQFNTDTAGNYDWQYLDGNASTPSSGVLFAQSSIALGDLTAATGTANVASACETTIHDYRGTTFQKTTLGTSQAKWGTTSGTTEIIPIAGWWRNTAAINAVKVLLSSGNFVDGSVVSLYGSF